MIPRMGVIALLKETHLIRIFPHRPLTQSSQIDTEARDSEGPSRAQTAEEAGGPAITRSAIPPTISCPWNDQAPAQIGNARSLTATRIA